jgi:hypothetical protein
MFDAAHSAGADRGTRQDEGAGSPTRLRRLDVTAHERVTHVADRQLDGESKTGVPTKDLHLSGPESQ